MNELFAGYANYASTKTVLIESLTAGNYEVSDSESWLTVLPVTINVSFLPTTLTITL